jgi:hypothetical protein
MNFIDKLFTTIMENARANATKMISNKGGGFIRSRGGAVSLLYHNGERWDSIALRNVNEFIEKLEMSGIYIEKISADFSNITSPIEALKNLKDQSHFVLNSKQVITSGMLLKIESGASTITHTEQSTPTDSRALNR